MPLDFGPLIGSGGGYYAVDPGGVYYETVVTDPANADVGATVSSHTTAFAGNVAIETAAAAIPMVGATVSIL